MDLKYKSLLIFLFLLYAQIAFSQLQNKTVKPLQGEGIYALLSRNGLDPQKHYQEFLKLNAGNLGKNNALLSYKTYVLPADKTILKEPLFGKEKEEYKIESRELEGAVIYLISGHGGPDPGASGKYGNHILNEDEYAYDITLRLGKRLREMGAKVYFIVWDRNDGIRSGKFLKYDRDETCMGETIPLNQNARLRQRVRKVNALSKENRGAKYERSISLHLDSRNNTRRLDVFFYHYHASKSGKAMAQTLRNTMEEKYSIHQPRRGFSGTVESRNLYEVKYTHPVSVFIELGNIRNYRDQQRFIIEDNRQALANWLSEGIVEDYKNSVR